MENAFYLAIEGPMGSGKTTLAGFLARAYQWDYMAEDVEGNPFLPLFASDRKHYQLPKTLFGCQRLYQQQVVIRGLLESGKRIVADYTFEKDELYARLSLSPADFKAYLDFRAEHGIKSVVKPHAILFLQADTNTLLKRLQLRGRYFERNIPREFLERVVKAYEQYSESITGCPIFLLDVSYLDFVASPGDRAAVLDTTRSWIDSIRGQLR